MKEIETFADYILKEEDLKEKLEITYYLAKKARIFFDRSVVFKTEILRMFLNYSKIEVDKNIVFTANLLCNCKKIDNAQDIEKIHSYATEGAEYLSGLGFDDKFCRICKEINRYSNCNPREKESDILELVDQFGGMLLDRPERVGFKPKEAIVLLEHRNLKDEYNRYANTFEEFVNFMENVQMSDVGNVTALESLAKLCNDSVKLKEFMRKVVYEYEPKVDKYILKENERQLDEMLGKQDENRALFTIETTKKVMNHILEENEKEKI